MPGPPAPAPPADARTVDCAGAAVSGCTIGELASDRAARAELPPPPAPPPPPPPPPAPPRGPAPPTAVPVAAAGGGGVCAAAWLAADAAPVPAWIPACAPLVAICIRGEAMLDMGEAPACGADVTSTGAPAAVTWAAWAANALCTSAITSAVLAMALLAAAIAAAQPHGKMMLGPIAAIVAVNSAMIAITRACACPTSAAAVARLERSASDWAATSDPLAIASAVLAPAALPPAPCHDSSSDPTACCSGLAVDPKVLEMPANICVGSTPSKSPGPKVPSASVTGDIRDMGSNGMPCPCCGSGGGGSSPGGRPSSPGGRPSFGEIPSRARISRTGKFR